MHLLGSRRQRTSHPSVYNRTSDPTFLTLPDSCRLRKVVACHLSALGYGNLTGVWHLSAEDTDGILRIM